MKGTDFERSVWFQLQKIPSGETRSYKEIAIAIGNPNSSRAVANACAKNTKPREIPCHRVIRSDGNMGGYSGPGGIQQKRILLDKEKNE